VLLELRERHVSPDPPNDARIVQGGDEAHAAATVRARHDGERVDRFGCDVSPDAELNNVGAARSRCRGGEPLCHLRHPAVRG